MSPQLAFPVCISAGVQGRGIGLLTLPELTMRTARKLMHGDHTIAIFRIEPCLPVQQGNLSMSNLDGLNAIR